MSTNNSVDLDAKEKLERFCFIGSFSPCLFRRREAVNVKDFYDKLEEVIAGISGKNFVAVIKKCASYDGIRKDEVFFAIYVYMFHPKIPTCEKTLVRNIFPEIATSGKELLLYLKYVKECSALKKRKLFSKSSKKMFEFWYKSQTSNTLCELFFANRTHYGFCHNDIFRIFHISDEATENSLIAKFLFKPNMAIEEPKKAKKFQSMRKIFKDSSEEEEIVPLLKNHKISFENVPKKLLKNEIIFNAILDNLQAPELLRLVSTLILEKFFKPTDCQKLLKPTFDKCVEKIKELYAENASRAVDQKVNIHPSNLLFILKTLSYLISNPESISLRKKKKSKVHKSAAAAAAAAKIKEPEVKTEVKFAAENEEIKNVMDIACKNYTGLENLRIFSTFQLSYTYHADLIRTSDFKVMEYLSAFSIVYPYTHCSKQNSCFMFGKMEALTPLEMKHSFEAEKEKLRIMYQNWTERGESKCHLPIKEAFSSKKTYDLFVTVVRYTSLCTKVQPLTTLFKKYRDHRNSKAKMVIINMRLKNQGLKFAESKNDGILEISHFDADTPNIIRAFALNYFN